MIVFSPLAWQWHEFQKIIELREAIGNLSTFYDLYESNYLDRQNLLQLVQQFVAYSRSAKKGAVGLEI